MHYVPILCLISAISLPLLSGCESFYRQQNPGTADAPPSIFRAAKLDANVHPRRAVTPANSLIKRTDETDDGPETAGDTPDESPGSVWDRLRRNFRMDLEHQHPRIQSQLNWYSGNQTYLDRTLERARRYLPYIISEIEARNMPGELALLPLVESAYNPFAYSHGRASGIWQFIPSTGRAFGMSQNWWYDGRRDIIASTQGALTYLKKLSARFDGDYSLALASYNAGASRVARAVRRNRARGEPTDFWHLSLPRETRHYLPKLIALARIIRDPEAHGVTLRPISEESYFRVVDIEGQMDLARAAEMAGVDVAEIYRLNPGFNRWATSPRGPHRLLVPATAADDFRKALQRRPPEQRVSWRDYEVERGDTLIGIARRFNTTPDVIRKHNNISGHTIRTGQTLLIPARGKSDGYYALSEQKRRESRQAASGGGDRRNMVRRVGYTVRSGDSLRRIANRFNIGVSDIAQWNDLNIQDYLQPGQQLKLFVDIRQTH